MKNEESVQQLMESNGILTVYELYAYELPKFLLRSTSGLRYELSTNYPIEKFLMAKTVSFV